MSTGTTSTSSSAPSRSPERGPGFLARTFRAFRYPDFRLMWIGACTSSIGSWMQIMAQAWLVYRISKSSASLGLDAFFAQSPIFLLSLFGGVFADRKSRRALLLMSQVIQMACAFILTALVIFNVVQVWHIWCLSFTVGIAQAFGGPAYSALIPTLVPKEDISNAIALNSIQFNLARVLGPALGGIAYTKLGDAWCFGLNGLSFVAVIITLLIIHPPFVPAKTTDSVMNSMKEGIGFIRNRDWMVSLVALAFLTTLLSFPLITFLPVFARDVFHGNAQTYTLLLCVSGFGSIAGALIVAGLKGKQARRSLFVLLILGLLIVGFGISHWVLPSCVFLLAAGACLMIVFASNLSVVQMQVEDAMRGRVMSVYNVAFRGGMPIGSLVCGLLIKQLSAQSVMVGNGVLVLAAAGYFMLMHRKLMTM